MSDLRIDKEGKWYYRGMEMSRRDIVTLFYGHLTKDAAGCHWIELGGQRCEVDIEDTPYVVWAVCVAGRKSTFEGDIYLLLSDDSIEELDPATVRIGKENVPYCRVKKGRFDARFSTSSYYQLAECIQHDPRRDESFISLRGQLHYIPDFQRA